MSLKRVMLTPVKHSVRINESVVDICASVVSLLNDFDFVAMKWRLCINNQNMAFTLCNDYRSKGFWVQTSPFLDDRGRYESWGSSSWLSWKLFWWESRFHEVLKTLLFLDPEYNNMMLHCVSWFENLEFHELSCVSLSSRSRLSSWIILTKQHRLRFFERFPKHASLLCALFEDKCSNDGIENQDTTLKEQGVRKE